MSTTIPPSQIINLVDSDDSDNGGDDDDAAASPIVVSTRHTSSPLKNGTCVSTPYGDGFVLSSSSRRRGERVYEVNVGWSRIYCLTPVDLSGVLKRLRIKASASSHVVSAETPYSSLVRLRPSFHLNDGVVDIYLQYLFKSRFPWSKSVHVFSSYFYKCMWEAPRHIKGDPRSFSERAFERIKSWTKRVDVFAKDFLIIPISDRNHWSLAIVCNPGLILTQNSEIQAVGRREVRAARQRARAKANVPRRKRKRSGRIRSSVVHREERICGDDESNDFEELPCPINDAAARIASDAATSANRAAALVSRAPFIVCLDSLRVHRTGTVCTRIRKYLSWEWKHRFEQCENVRFDADAVPSVVPNAPRQVNDCDCGVFLLHYAEKFFDAFPSASLMTFHALLHSLSPVVTPEWFRLNDISRKRTEIERLFQAGCL